jgi:competence protein ComEC
VVGLIPGPLVAAPAFAAGSIAWLIVSLTRVFATLPFSTIDVASPSAAWMAVYGIGLVVLVFTLRWMARGTDQKIVTGWLLIALIGSVLLTWDFWRPPPRGMRVTFFDVGEGDSALLELPAGSPRGGVFRVLIDGGGSWGSAAGTFDAGERIIGRSLRGSGIKRLDAVFLSHPDMDHMNGLLWALGNIKVDRFIDTAVFADTACETTKNKEACSIFRRNGPGPANPGPGRRERYAEILKLVGKKRVEYIPARGGSAFTIPSGAKLLILNPERNARPGDAQKNNLSMVVKAAYGRGSALFTGDIQRETEEWLVRCYGGLLGSDVLKVPHHGSSTSSSTPFVEGVRPSAAVISTGGPGFYGHPQKEVLETYKREKVALFRTDKQSTIVCGIDPGGGVKCRQKHVYRFDF